MPHRDEMASATPPGTAPTVIKIVAEDAVARRVGRIRRWMDDQDWGGPVQDDMRFLLGLLDQRDADLTLLARFIDAVKNSRERGLPVADAMSLEECLKVSLIVERLAP